MTNEAASSVPAAAPMVIIGAGHVGGRAAQALREAGWTGPLVLVGAEAHPPYERPPLSKGVLTGAQTLAQCAIAPLPDDLTLHLGTHCVAIDTARRQVTLQHADGATRELAYTALLLATGGHARRLDAPGADLPQLLTLRNADDALALAPRLGAGRSMLMVGGGFIGLEVAASARQAGAEVVVVEGAPRLLGRAVPAEIAERVLQLHRAHGVDVRLGCVPTRFEAEAGAADPERVRVMFSDGRVQAFDSVVVGIGIAPAVELARAAGIEVNQGVVVDAQLRTSAPRVYAAGDVCEFPSPLSGRPMRHESWANAEAQARIAARNMAGGHAAFADAAWFWSDQFDHQLQVCGEPALGTQRIERPLGEDALLHFQLDAEGRVLGASGFGPVSAVAKELKLARLLVDRRAVLAEPQRLADPQTKLKSLLPSP